MSAKPDSLRERLELSVRAARLGVKIRTDFVYPPIPSREFDYAAVTDNYDAEWCGEEDGWRSSDPIGYGRTEIEAIESLLEQLEDQGD